MIYPVPELSLILLVGASGSGKSTFARKNFLPTEVVSSDACRGMVWDDEMSLEATGDAFELLHFIVRKRLQLGKLTVVDATNVRAEDRRELGRIAHEMNVLSAAFVFNIRQEVCHERNQSRPDRQFGPHVVRNHTRLMKASIRDMGREHFRFVHVLNGPEQVDAAEIIRQKSWSDRRDDKGPFDVIGDVHGCWDELSELMDNLGYTVERLPEPEVILPDIDSIRQAENAWMRRARRYFRVTAPEGRKAIFLGDLIDRGPNSVDALKFVMSMVADGTALCVPGNHDVKLLKLLRGRNVTLTHGLAGTVEQLNLETEEFRSEVANFIDCLVSHLVLNDGDLVVAHAGMKQEFQMRASGRVREFALYGESTGETDEFGLPVRYPWAQDYRGRARVIYGHTPVPQPEWLNNTLCIDTGCAFGGALTALRYPELTQVRVTAKQTYAEPARPLELNAQGLSGQHAADDVLDLADVSGKRIVETRLRGNVTLREENSAAALEAISRFATNPKWLVYLPPTMSPCETSTRESYLEYPDEAFAYFRDNGCGLVVCEEKHMGSRAVIVLCRDESVAARRFGVDSGEIGVIVTRTGRRFFDEIERERALLDRIGGAMTNSGLWDRLETDWIVLDTELMPWSAKAQQLLRRQYAPVGASGQAALAAAVRSLHSAQKAMVSPSEELDRLAQRIDEKHTAIDKYVDAYRRYCWTVATLDDLKIAPFHILATEGRAHVDKNHTWHMDTLAELCAAEPRTLFRTPYLEVDTTDEASVARGVAWWEDLTGKGGEGMVVKPLDFVGQGDGGIIQPAIKCRGSEYLRIIYGPEYDRPEHLLRLRKRGLSTKRSLALREFALGVEALERFVRQEPLRRVHECVFAVLAMESEPVDPRL